MFFLATTDQLEEQGRGKDQLWMTDQIDEPTTVDGLVMHFQSFRQIKSNNPEVARSRCKFFFWGNLDPTDYLVTILSPTCVLCRLDTIIHTQSCNMQPTLLCNYQSLCVVMVSVFNMYHKSGIQIMGKTDLAMTHA